MIKPKSKQRIPSCIPSKKTLTSLLLTAGVFQLPLTAELLVYEGFSGYAAGDISGQAATGTGLTGNWSKRAGESGVTSYTNSGLTFGSLATSGGAASLLTGYKNTSVVGVEMNLSSSVTGTLYSSMLFNFSNFDGNDGSLTGMRISDDIESTSNVRLSTYADHQESANANPAVAYDDGRTSSLQSLSENTTYMAISIFTNVGKDLSLETGVGSVYVLTEAQFEDFVANGRSEANLTGRATGSGADQIIAFASDSRGSGTYSFNDGNFMGLSSYGDANQNLAGTYDELRWSTDLDSVAVIPEPGTLALAGGLSALALVLFRRRRR